MRADFVHRLSHSGVSVVLPRRLLHLRDTLDDDSPLTRLKAVDRFVAMSNRFQKKEGSATAEDVIRKCLELAGESLRTVNAADARRMLVIDQPALPAAPLALIPSNQEEETPDASSSEAPRS